jgi:hypothetical protein
VKGGAVLVDAPGAVCVACFPRKTLRRACGTPDAQRSVMRLRASLGFLPFVIACVPFPVPARSLAYTHEPSRLANCDIAFERFSPQEAAAKWRQIGVVCLSPGMCSTGTGHWRECTVEDVYRNRPLRDQLREDACRMGGEILSPVALCTTGEGRWTSPGIEFGVYQES